MPQQTMKEAHVSKDTRVTLHDVPIPEPTEPYSIIVKVIVAGTNPKDWKMPAGILTTIADCPNSGDDVAGIVHSTHPTVTSFKRGDRIAGLHELGKPHGAFAEFALLHSFSSFHIPSHMSFEAAATLPMATVMAGIGLFAELRVASGPWLPLRDPKTEADEERAGYFGKPALIYGASGAVGQMAVKFAQIANVHPLICVAGAGCDDVRRLIDEEKGDTVIDYRTGAETLRRAIANAIPAGKKLEAAFDVVTEHGSWNHICSALDPEVGRLTITLPPAKSDVPRGVEQSATMAASLWRELRSLSGEDLGGLGFRQGEGRQWGWVWNRGVEALLEEQKLEIGDYEVVDGGLGKGLEQALRAVRWEKAGKRVVRVAEG